VRTLTGETRQCSWTGQKAKCASHTDHDFSLPADDDPTFQIPEPISPNRVALNRTVLRIAGEFVASTNLSFRSAASPPMFNFIIKLIQLGASLPRDRLNTIQDVATLIDTFSDKAIASEVRAIGDTRFEASMIRLQELCFVNLIVDAGQIHQMKMIPCILTNPYCADPPVILALHENSNLTMDLYAQLFANLVEMVQPFNLVISSIVIDNLPAQASGLDSFLESTKSAILHVRCFAHMTNLILENTMCQADFANLMSVLTRLQVFLRRRDSITIIGKRCPKFVRTRWFFMVDTLSFIVDNIEVIHPYLEIQTVDKSVPNCIPAEIYELYAILLPFKCFLNAVEARNCALPMIVSLVRSLLAALRDIIPLLKTRSAVTIFHDMYISLMARLATNNRREVMASYSLTLMGRWEIRKAETGYRVSNPNSVIGVPSDDSNLNIKIHLKTGDYDTILGKLNDLIAVAPILTTDENVSPSLFSEPSQSDTSHSPATYKEYLAAYSAMSHEERVHQNPYEGLYENGRAVLYDLCEKLDQSHSEIDGAWNAWLFAEPALIQFLTDAEALSSTNLLWRTAHAYREWKSFAVLALRLVSAGTSESDAERILSIAKYISSHSGTRYNLETLRARLIGLQERKIVLQHAGEAPGEKPTEWVILDEDSEEEE
jgi:hypothetical protein